MQGSWAVVRQFRWKHSMSEIHTSVLKHCRIQLLHSFAVEFPSFDFLNFPTTADYIFQFFYKIGLWSRLVLSGKCHCEITLFQLENDLKEKKAHYEARGSFVSNKHWILSALFMERLYVSPLVVKEQVSGLRQKSWGVLRRNMSRQKSLLTGSSSLNFTFLTNSWQICMSGCLITKYVRWTVLLKFVS